MTRCGRFIPLLLAAFSIASPALASDRALTLAERIAAQRVVERVYYGHQIGATEPFDTARTPAFIEEKALRTLRLSAALESMWHAPITAAMLREETERIARDTRFPDRLYELYAALGNDPVLFQETVARAALAETLARDAYARDERIQGDSRREALDLVERLGSGALKAGADHPRLSMVEVVLDRRMADRGEPFSADDLAALRRESVVRLSSSDFNSLRSDLAPGDARAMTLHDAGTAFVVRVPLAADGDRIKVAMYVVPKPSWDSWWTEHARDFDPASVTTVAQVDRSLPAPAAAVACGAGGFWSNGRLMTPPYDSIFNTTAVWTGTEMIVWGGGGGGDVVNGVRTGSRYDPITDTWHPTSLVNAPSERFGHSAVWTGSRMIIWGGKRYGPCNGPFPCSVGGGASYDPVNDAWQAIGTAGSPPAARDQHFAAWTGTRMLIWGGESVSVNNVRTYPTTGGLYDPASGTWTPMSLANAPTGRTNGAAVWTGTRFVVWGGTGAALTNTGGRYDPATDTWQATSLTNAPSARFDHGAAWDGHELLVWGGGAAAPAVLSDGARYDPDLDQWAPLATLGAPSARRAPSASWSGSQLLVWGGVNGSNAALGDGARYDPALDLWSPMSGAEAPGPRSQHVATWAGDRLLIWGGNAAGSGSVPLIPLGNARYDPATDVWTPIDPRFVPHARSGHIATWTGTLMLLTEGYDLRDHGRYDPLLDLWTPTAPHTGISRPSSVWTGTELITWGGMTGGPVNVGYRYNPATDTWQLIPGTSGPAARFNHTAVWTGSVMVIWGGSDANFQPLNNGGRYNPATSSWVATPIPPSPAARTEHTAVWTGSRMIVWGGYSTGPDPLNTGDLYDPAANTWVGTTPLSQAPANRYYHSTVWTGSEMLIWGGDASIAPPVVGALFNPASNTWRPMSSVNQPSVSRLPQVTWTGTKLLVWGPGGFGAGGQYDVAADNWTAIPDQGSPNFRGGFSAAQAGSAMIVWGGEANGGGLYKTGGLYCPCATGVPYYGDADGDGHGAAGSPVLSCGPINGYVADGSDCNDASSGVWGAPSDTGLLAFSDATHMEWLPPADPGGVSWAYDVIRGSSPDLAASGMCRAGDLLVTSFDDLDNPPLGGSFYYRIRAGNSCGEGILGYRSGGVPIAGGPACP